MALNYRITFYDLDNQRLGDVTSTTVDAAKRMALAVYNAGALIPKSHPVSTYNRINDFMIGYVELTTIQENHS